ncbi:MAG: hypothetical protein AAF797_02390 [Planctomycetota bacterium]
MKRPDLHPHAAHDICGPPQVPEMVSCLHCGLSYPSTEIEYRLWPDGVWRWSCPVRGCDGIGYGHDIHHVRLFSHFTARGTG